MSDVSSAKPRPYHHGDLRNALVRAAADLAAVGGPEAVTVRGAARAVGVTPTAAYRHFANQADLFHAAKEQAMVGLATAMAEHLAAVPRDDDPVTVAIGRLTSTGRAYVRFALDEPGIFRTCFTGTMVLDEPTAEADADADADAGAVADAEADAGALLGEQAPYALLGEMLDALVEVGYLDPADRPGAEAGPWAAVHGLALLLLDGPLRRASDAEREAAIESTLALVAQGLATGPAARR